MKKDNDYFHYLLGKVNAFNRERICKFLYGIEFTWDDTIPLEFVRAEKGTELRLHYFYETGRHTSLDGEECRVLELLVALAIGMDNVMSLPGEERPGQWFEEMIENLGLDGDNSKNLSRIVRWMSRTYEKDGSGGLFPLKNSGGVDQRRQSLWNQANAYLVERM